MNQSSPQLYYTVFPTPLCEIILIGNEDGLQRIHLNTREGQKELLPLSSYTKNDAFFKDIKAQIEEYFQGKRKTFEITLNPEGTPYQKRVWEELQKIPYGEMRSYKEIAQALRLPNAARAVGMATGKNPLPLIIPCHRVVGSDGSMTGFAFGIDAKKFLLGLEQK